MAKSAEKQLRVRLSQIDGLLGSPSVAMSWDQKQGLWAERSQILGSLALVEALWRTRY